VEERSQLRVSQQGKQRADVSVSVFVAASVLVLLYQYSKEPEDLCGMSRTLRRRCASPASHSSLVSLYAMN
jgi:hypothetical protein